MGEELLCCPADYGVAQPVFPGPGKFDIDKSDVWIAAIFAMPITMSAMAIYAATRKKKTVPVSP